MRVFASSSGCVSSGKYRSLEQERDALAGRNQALQGEVNTANQKGDALTQEKTALASEKEALGQALLQGFLFGGQSGLFLSQGIALLVGGIDLSLEGLVAAGQSVALLLQRPVLAARHASGGRREDTHGLSIMSSSLASKHGARPRLRP